ncbi:MAG: helix-turn-helix domain-containing protein [Muribaculaceae bacterium]|nr:helix-turn-helix domain-containing protein [Muribaculaceae bacterium]
MTTTNPQQTLASQFDDRKVLDLLDRLEAARKVLEQTDDIEDAIKKMNNLEFYLRRFGTIKELAAHLAFIEKKMYILKEYLTVNEAADYLNLSSSLIYKLTSKHELPIYKPNGKTIFIHRDDLNRWIAKNKILSQDEIEEYAMTQMSILGKGRMNPIKNQKRQ